MLSPFLLHPKSYLLRLIALYIYETLRHPGIKFLLRRIFRRHYFLPKCRTVLTGIMCKSRVKCKKKSHNKTLCAADTFGNIKFLSTVTHSYNSRNNTSYELWGTKTKTNVEPLIRYIRVDHHQACLWECTMHVKSTRILVGTTPGMLMGMHNVLSTTTGPTALNNIYRLIYYDHLFIFQKGEIFSGYYPSERRDFQWVQ